MKTFKIFLLTLVCVTFFCCSIPSSGKLECTDFTNLWVPDEVFDDNIDVVLETTLDYKFYDNSVRITIHYGDITETDVFQKTGSDCYEYIDGNDTVELEVNSFWGSISSFVFTVYSHGKPQFEMTYE